MNLLFALLFYIKQQTHRCRKEKKYTWPVLQIVQLKHKRKNTHTFYYVGIETTANIRAGFGAATGAGY